MRGIKLSVILLLMLGLLLDRRRPPQRGVNIVDRHRREDRAGQKVRNVAHRRPDRSWRRGKNVVAIGVVVRVEDGDRGNVTPRRRHRDREDAEVGGSPTEINLQPD